MKKLVFSLLTLSTVLMAKDAFKMMQSEELSTLMGNKEAKLAILDANNAKTRKTDGIIPGAKMLTSYDKYDVAKELPTAKDTKLVFYCANTQCMASHAAAERAIQNGYTDVNVMSDGIQGWKKAGKPSSKM